MGGHGVSSSTSTSDSTSRCFRLVCPSLSVYFRRLLAGPPKRTGLCTVRASRLILKRINETQTRRLAMALPRSSVPLQLPMAAAFLAVFLVTGVSLLSSGCGGKNAQAVKPAEVAAEGVRGSEKDVPVYWE